jgi:hypothetical protein
MTRLPELIEEHADDAVPDASQSIEIDELVRSVPKLIGILPDVLRNTWDPRHPAALSVMVAGLVAQVDRMRPLVLVGVSLFFLPRRGISLALLLCSHKCSPRWWMKQ